MKSIQLIYASRPFGFNEWTLNDILDSARRRNRRDGITGALICRHDMYLQLLEGPSDAVNAAFKRINADDRHVEIAVLWSGDMLQRLFPSWEMRHDPVKSWMWTEEQVVNGALKRTNPLQLRALFARVAAQPNEAVVF